jgi:hypothetical protein
LIVAWDTKNWARDLLVRQACRNQHQHFGLSVAQCLGWDSDPLDEASGDRRRER